MASSTRSHQTASATRSLLPLSRTGRESSPAAPAMARTPSALSPHPLLMIRHCVPATSSRRMLASWRITAGRPARPSFPSAPMQDSQQTCGASSPKPKSSQPRRNLHHRRPSARQRRHPPAARRTSGLRSTGKVGTYRAPALNQRTKAAAAFLEDSMHLSFCAIAVSTTTLIVSSNSCWLRCVSSLSDRHRSRRRPSPLNSRNKPAGLRRLRRDLRRQIRQGGRVPDQGSRRAARLLRLPGRALEASAHDERRRKLVRHGAATAPCAPKDVSQTRPRSP
jgi:hypothetical protein